MGLVHLIIVLHFKDSKHITCDNSPFSAYLLSDNASVWIGFPTFGADVHSLFYA